MEGTAEQSLCLISPWSFWVTKCHPTLYNGFEHSAPPALKLSRSKEVTPVKVPQASRVRDG